jgi:hypothetical protein
MFWTCERIHTGQRNTSRFWPPVGSIVQKILQLALVRKQGGRSARVNEHRVFVVGNVTVSMRSSRPTQSLTGVNRVEHYAVRLCEVCDRAADLRG